MTVRARAVHAVVAGWERFWFRPQPTSTLAVFRIAVGLLTTLWTVNLIGDTQGFFGPHGLVAGSGAAGPVVALLLIAAIALTLGFHPQVAAGLALFCTIWLHRIDPLVWNTGDVLLRHLLLFLALAPSGASISLDRLRQRPARFWEFPARAPWALRLVQLQVVLMYVTTVVAKVQGWTWRHGTAVSYVLRLPHETRFVLPTSITSSVAWAHLLTWGTLAVETAIPVLVWPRRTRPFVLAAGVGLHVAIMLTLRVGFFSWIVLASYLAFLPADRAERILLHLARRRPGYAHASCSASVWTSEGPASRARPSTSTPVS